MHFKKLAFVVLFLTVAAFPPASASPDPSLVDRFGADFTGRSALLRRLDWEKKLFQLLSRDKDVHQAAISLAPQMGATVARTEDLIWTWLRWVEEKGLRHIHGPAQAPYTMNAEREFFEILEEWHFDPQVVAIVADFLITTRNCDLAYFRKVTDAAGDPLPAGWQLADTTGCEEWWRELHARFPESVAVLWQFASAPAMPKAERVAIWQRLKSWNHVGNSSLDQPIFSDLIELRYLQSLFGSGLVDEAIAGYESLSSEALGRIIRFRTADIPFPGRREATVCSQR